MVNSGDNIRGFCRDSIVLFSEGRFNAHVVVAVFVRAVFLGDIIEGHAVRPIM